MKKQDRLKQLEQAIQLTEKAKNETESEIQSGDTSEEKAEWLEIHTETEKRLKERRENLTKSPVWNGGATKRYELDKIKRTSAANWYQR